MADILPPAPIDAPFGAYNWVDWYKKVRDIINAGGNIQHNILLGLQGGGTGEYYHLTSAQLADFNSLLNEQWVYVKLNTDYTTSSTSPIDVPGLSFTPEASKTYVVEAMLLTESSDVTTGVKPGVSWPTGLTNGAARIDSTNGSTTTVIANLNYGADGSANGTDMPAADTSYLATILATFSTSTTPSGDFQITLATE